MEIEVVIEAIHCRLDNVNRKTRKEIEEWRRSARMSDKP